MVPAGAMWSLINTLKWCHFSSASDGPENIKEKVSDENNLLSGSWNEVRSSDLCKSPFDKDGEFVEFFKTAHYNWIFEGHLNIQKFTILIN